MPMIEGKVDHVIGVDTHRDTHAATILDRNGGLVAELEVPSDQACGEVLLRFVSWRSTWRPAGSAGGPSCTLAPICNGAPPWSKEG